MRRAGKSTAWYATAMAAHKTGRPVVVAGLLEIARGYRVVICVLFQPEPGDAARAAQEVGE